MAIIKFVGGALYIPLIVMPSAVDQVGIVVRVQHAGAGFYLDKNWLTAERVRTAVETVSSPEHKKACSSVSIAGAEKAADLVEFHEEVGYDQLVPALDLFSKLSRSDFSVSIVSPHHVMCCCQQYSTCSDRVDFMQRQACSTGKADGKPGNEATQFTFSLQSICRYFAEVAFPLQKNYTILVRSLCTSVPLANRLLRDSYSFER